MEVASLGSRAKIGTKEGGKQKKFLLGRNEMKWNQAESDLTALGQSVVLKQLMFFLKLLGFVLEAAWVKYAHIRVFASLSIHVVPLRAWSKDHAHCYRYSFASSDSLWLRSLAPPHIGLLLVQNGRLLDTPSLLCLWLSASILGCPS